MSMDALQPRLDAMTGPMVPVGFEVTAKRQDTEDVWTLELVACSGEPQPGLCQAADARQHEGGTAPLCCDRRFEGQAQVLPRPQTNRQRFHRVSPPLSCNNLDDLTRPGRA